VTAGGNARDDVGEDQEAHALADARWVMSSASHMTKAVPAVMIATMKDRARG